MRILRRIELGGIVVFLLMLLVLILAYTDRLQIAHWMKMAVFTVMIMGAVAFTAVILVFCYYAIRYQVRQKGLVYLMVPIAWFFLVASLVGIVDVLFASRVFSVARCSFAGLSGILLSYGTGINFQKARKEVRADRR